MYYNWYTATAGQGDKDFGIGSPTDDAFYAPSTPGDICPAGWRIPPAALNADYQPFDDFNNPDIGSALYLINTLNTSAVFFSHPNNIVASGMYEAGIGSEDYDPRVIDQYSNESYDMNWTSTINYYGDDEPIKMFYRPYPELNLYGSGGSGKTFGHTIRCRVK